MKNNKVQRITLNRETLRHLAPMQLKDVAAGVISGPATSCTPNCTVTYPHASCLPVC